MKTSIRIACLAAMTIIMASAALATGGATRAPLEPMQFAMVGGDYRTEMDTNGDGVVSPEERRAAKRKAAEHRKGQEQKRPEHKRSAPPEKPMPLFDRFDKDGNKSLSRAEFAALMEALEAHWVKNQ